MNVHDLYNKWLAKNYHLLDEVLIYDSLLRRIDKSTLSGEAYTKYIIMYDEITNILEASL